MNMETMVARMDESFRALQDIRQTEEQFAQLMELSRGLMLKLEDRDHTIALLRAEVITLKRRLGYAE